MAAAAWGWALVVPVKRLERAKTRLALAPEPRAALALAMAADTVRAGLATVGAGGVVVVTDDARAAAVLAAAGAVVVADEPDDGLNAAVRHGARAALARRPDGGVVAVSSDLAALTREGLQDVLARCAAPLSCVADAAGTGTVLLAARTLESFTPAFGIDSRRRHVDLGAVDLTDAAAAVVRRDVDTLADLAAARDLGVGPATAAWLEKHAHLLG